MKKTVYLDSTIPSYLFDQRDSIRQFIEVTKKWWKEEREHFQVVISEATLIEVGDGDHPYKDQVVKCVSELEVLSPDPAIDEIVRTYVKNLLMPRGSTGDAAHLAYASFYSADFLLTWNCNHLANANKKQHIKTINGRLNLPIPEIVTPMELFTETG
jgi:hypothetical protein